MATNKKSFLLYCDIIHTVEKLTDEQAGNLFKHILKYVNDLNPEPESIITELTFEPIRQALKRDLKKYEFLCERNRINGLKGGRPETKPNPIEPKKPTGLFCNPTEPKKPDSDIDIDSDIDKDIIKKYIDGFNFIKKSSYRSLRESDQKKLLKALKTYSMEEILSCLKNAMTKQNHIDSKFIYLTPEFFTRVDKIEMYLDSKSNIPTQKFAKANSEANSKANSEYEYDIVTVIDYLNNKLSTNYKSSSNKNISLISARLKEKYTVDDFKTVIDAKYIEWFNNLEFKKFLRPETLFGNHFEGYLNTAKLSNTPTVAPQKRRVCQ